MPIKITDLPRRSLTALASLSARRAWWILILAAALTILSLGHAARTLSIDTSTENMLAEDLPFRQRHTDFRNALPALKGNIVIVIDAATPDLADDGAERLSRRLMQMDDVFSTVFDPANHPFFRRNGLLFLSLDQLDDLSIRVAEAQPLLAALAEDPSLRGLFSVLNESLAHAGREDFDLSALAGALDAFAAGAENLTGNQAVAISWQNLLGGEISPAPARRIVLAKPFLDFTSLSPARRAVDAIRSSAASLGLSEDNGVRLRLTGNVVIEQDELRSVREGATLAGVLSFLLVAFLTMTGLRSPRLIAATLTTLALGLIWTAGYAALAIGRLNIISVAFAVLFIGIGVDFGIQYCLRYREKIIAGLDNRRALAEAADGAGPALALAATAAAIGFLSFVPTDYIGLSELGEISAAGMAVALLANFTVLPALLTVWPLKVAKGGLEQGLWLDRLWRGFAAGLTLARARMITLCALVITLIAAGLGAERLRFDYDPLNLKDPTAESYLTARELQSGDHSGYGVSLLAASNAEAVILAEQLAALPVVSHTASPTDYVPADQEDKLAVIDDMALYIGPALTARDNSSPGPGDNRAALAALLTQAENSLKADTPGQAEKPLRRFIKALRPYDGVDDEKLEQLQAVLLANLTGRLDRLRDSLEAGPISLETLPAILRQRLIAEDGRHVVRAFPREDVRDLEALTRFVETISAAFPEATDTPVLIYRSGDVVIKAFYIAGIISAAAIGLLLLAVLRQPAEAALTAAPLAMAAALTAGVAGLSGIHLNFANMIAVPLIVSLGVAYGLYIVMRSRGKGGIRAALSTSTPRAILFSALTTMGSFGSLALSPHRGTASMGLLMSIALTMTLVSTFTLLPALLAWREERNRSRSQT